MPFPHGEIAEPVVAACAGFSDFESATRVTPCTPRRRDIICATSVCVGAQPTIVMAGAEIEPRSGSPPEALLAPGRPMSPLSDWSFTSAGVASDTSRSARSQSKRAAARPRTVSTRAFASVSKSA